ncbi:MAG: XTP/dITP diphosphatase [Gemmatimonadetes bacterium]|nr:XTP/dITP diphosphatase [Gemmatimonadota bacterium]MYG86549.1 XTP/dITP diphosphatase [Gemmatimonadota bacterium]MYJ89583.1 XTP/dITP diphosphatase [Gemmatimonadota bacterium]
MTLVLATRNPGKISEIKALLPGVRVAPAASFTGCPEPEETGRTFEENALIKARAVSLYTGKTTLADDSGLEVDALDGAPGVHSARYAGRDPTDQDNIRRLLGALDGISDAERTARFRCVMAVVVPDGRTWTAEGACEGRILQAPRGDAGFGYDPLFVPEGYENTFAELDAGVKNRISHRALALQRIADVLKSLADHPD